MELAEIIKHATMQPFQPFRIHLENGTVICVRHPENIIFLPNRAKVRQIYAYDPEKDEAWYFGHSAVTAIQPIDQGADG
jgi:hypothetical protein